MMIKFLCDHPDVTGFTEAHNIKYDVWGDGNPRSSRTDIPTKIDWNGLNVVQSHIHVHFNDTPPHQQHMQVLATVEKPYAVPLRDPLSAIITHKIHGPDKDHDYAPKVWSAYLRMIEGLIQMGKEDIAFVPVDLLSKATPKERCDALEKVCNVYGLRIVKGHLSSWANSWQKVNSTEFTELKQLYSRRDLAGLRKHLKKEINTLEAHEKYIRPVLERAGYRDLMWWS